MAPQIFHQNGLGKWELLHVKTMLHMKLGVHREAYSVNFRTFSQLLIVVCAFLATSLRAAFLPFANTSKWLLLESCFLKFSAEQKRPMILRGLLSRVGLWCMKFLSFQQEILLLDPWDHPRPLKDQREGKAAAVYESHKMTSYFRAWAISCILTPLGTVVACLTPVCQDRSVVS